MAFWSELEDHFILRLPKADADTVKEILKSKPRKVIKALKIKLEDALSSGYFSVNKKRLHAKMFRLPTLIESNFCTNNVNLYKTADVCHILMCGEEQFPTAIKHEASKENQPISQTCTRRIQEISKQPHGITPPMKNVMKQRFRKQLKNLNPQDTVDVEKEVMLLLRTDYEAVSSRYEIIYTKDGDGTYKKNSSITEDMLFGTIISDSDGESDSHGSNDIIEFNN